MKKTHGLAAHTGFSASLPRPVPSPSRTNVAACVPTGPVDELGYKYPITSAQSPGILLGWFPHMEHVRKYDTGNYKTFFHVQFPLIYMHMFFFMITPNGSSPIMHQSAVLFKAGVAKKNEQVILLKRLSFTNK